jgi:hypothetical protein
VVCCGRACATSRLSAAACEAGLPHLQLQCCCLVVLLLQVGCPGPALTFDFLFCPMCGSGKEGRCGNIQVGGAIGYSADLQCHA